MRGGFVLPFADPNGRALGHEVGHRLSLDHGNGVDDDFDGIVDNEPVGSNQGPNLMQYDSGLVLTQAQIAQIRAQALMNIPDRIVDPVPAPLADVRVDELGDVPATETFIDIREFGLSVEPEGGTITFFTSTLGLLPQNIQNLSYLFLVDLDGNPTTGGSALAAGTSTTATGIDVVGRVRVDVVNGTAHATPSLSVFQGGQFVPISDASIQARVRTQAISILQFAGVPLLRDTRPAAQEIELEFKSELVGARAPNIVITALAQNPKTGTVDTAGGRLTFELPAFPSCQVVPPSAVRGNTVAIVVSSFPPGATAEAFLESSTIGSSSIDASGNAVIPMVIPQDAPSGSRPLRVGVEGTAINPDCGSVTIVEPAGRISNVDRFSGKAHGVGRRAGVTGIAMVGTFLLDGELDLAACPGKVTIGSLLNEVRGVRETVANLPLILRGDCRNTASTGYFRTTGQGQRGEVIIGAHGKGVYTFRVKVTEATSSVAAHCPTTALTTAFEIDDGVNPPVVVSTLQPWLCFGTANQYIKSPP